MTSDVRTRAASDRDSFAARLLSGITMLVFIALSFCGSAPAAADATSASSTAADPNQWCAVYLRNIEPVDLAGDLASVYYLSFGSREGVGATASGTASLFAGDDRYDIAFRDAPVMPRSDPHNADTVYAIHFAAPVRLDGGYVSELAGPRGGPCAANGAEFTPNGPIKRPAAVPRPTFAALHIVDVTAPAPVRDPLPACAVPYARPKALTAVGPPVKGDVAVSRLQVETWILLRIAPNGNVIDASVMRPSPFSRFDESVRQAAARSTFSPAIFRCNEVGGEYEYVGVYDPVPE